MHLNILPDDWTKLAWNIIYIKLQKLFHQLYGPYFFVWFLDNQMFIVILKYAADVTVWQLLTLSVNSAIHSWNLDIEASKHCSTICKWQTKDTVYNGWVVNFHKLAIRLKMNNYKNKMESYLTIYCSLFTVIAITWAILSKVYFSNCNFYISLYFRMYFF